MEPKITQINSDQLKAVIANDKEKNYSLIDVREEFEYNDSHIPGALWIKLSDIEKQPYLVPESDKIIFYCRSGARSMAAAQIFAESANISKSADIQNLESGMIGWDGAQLDQPPKLDVFKGKTEIEDLIKRAMELEKGAFILYSSIYDNYKELPYIDTINMLRKAETAHAKTLFKRLGKPMQEFDEYFASLKGDILESGIETEEALKKIESLNGNLCINILEFLLMMEVSAYDLYKVMAKKEKAASKTFLTIAQEEKSHMRIIASSFILCS